MNGIKWYTSVEKNDRKVVHVINHKKSVTTAVFNTTITCIQMSDLSSCACHVHKLKLI